MATSDRLKKARGNSRRKRRHCFRQSTLGGVAISSGGLASHSAPRPRTNTTAYPAALSWWQADNTQPAQLQTAQKTIQQASEAGALGWDDGMGTQVRAFRDSKYLLIWGGPPSVVLRMLLFPKTFEYGG